MTKREYILTLLARLDGIRELAAPLKALIEHVDVDHDFIDGLSAMLMQAVHDTSDAIQQKKLRAGQEFLQKIKLQDQIDHESADSELEAMLAQI